MPYSLTRFAANAGLTAASTSQSLYTVPANQTALVTHVSIGVANGDANLDLYLGGDTDSMSAAGGWGSNLIYNQTFPSGGLQLRQGFYVVGSGGQIGAYSRSGHGNLYFNITGLVGSGKMQGCDLWKASKQVGTTGDSNIYTVPTGRTLVVKTIVITNLAGSEASRQASVRIGANPVTDWFNSGYRVLAAGQTVQHDGSWIATAGESLTANVNAVGNPGCVFYLSGLLY